MKFDAFMTYHWFDKTKSIKQIYDDMLEYGLLAEELGFDTVWIGEHHLIDFISCPGPFAVAGLLAGLTKNIRIGIGVVITPFYHPLKLMGDIAVTDLLSNGRLEVGIGRGAFPHALKKFGYSDIEKARAAFIESTEIMLQMWSGEEAISHKGEYWEFENARVIPTPLQKPHPPIWVAGQTFPTIEWGVSKHLNVMNTPWRDSFQRVKDVCAVHQAAMAKYGVTRDESQLVMSRMTYVGETEKEVREQLKYVHYYNDLIVSQHADVAKVQNGTVIHQRVADETGKRLVDPNRFGWDGASKSFADDELMENLIFGTPDVVIKKIQEYEDAGVDHIKFYMAYGQPHEDTMRTMRLFAKEVMPHFRKQEAEKAKAAAQAPVGAARS